MIDNTSFADPGNIPTPKTLGKLIEVLSELDLDTPIRTSTEHFVSPCRIVDQDRDSILHSIKLGIEFDFISK